MIKDSFLVLLEQMRDSAYGLCERERLDNLKAQYVLEKKAREAEDERRFDYYEKQQTSQQLLFHDLEEKHATTVALFNDLLQKKEEEIQQLTKTISELSKIERSIMKSFDDIVERKKDYYGSAEFAFERLSETAGSD